MTDRGHVIKQMEVLLCFDSEDEALLEQGDLGDFVSNKLLPVLDDAFSELSVPGTVLRIDRLELDLGRMSYRGFRQEMVQRLGELVREVFRESFSSLGPALDDAIEPPEPQAGQAGQAGQAACGCEGPIPAVAGEHGYPGWGRRDSGQTGKEAGSSFASENPGQQGGAESVTRERSDLDLLVFFLENGYLPWHAGTQGAPDLEPMLLRVIQASGMEFRRRLQESPERERAGRRLARQFSEKAVAAIVEAFSLGADDGWLVAQLPSSPSRHLPISSPRRELAAALRGGDFLRMQTVWRKLLLEMPSMLLQEIKTHGREETVRRKIVARFSHDMLLDIVSLLEPAEAGFIEEVIKRPELLSRAADLHRENPDGIRQRLWLFTLDYLLVERTSEFNRRSYLGSILRQTAAHYNLDYDGLLGSLQLVLTGTDLQGTLKREMLELLRDLTGDVAGSSRGAHPLMTMRRSHEERNRVGRSRNPRPSNSAPGFFPAGVVEEGSQSAEEVPAAMLLRKWLRKAFLSGDIGSVADWWPQVVKQRPQLVVATLREQERTAAARKMAEGFPLGVLADVVVLLEPLESGFIFEMVDRPELFRQPSGSPLCEDDHLRRRLWEFTLIYLLEERGSEFNRRAYLANVLERVSAHFNVDQRQLLRSLQQVLSAVKTSSALRDEMLLLLTQLTQDDAVSPPLPGAATDGSEHNTTTTAVLDKLITCLSSWGQGVHALLVVWREMISRGPIAVRETLSQIIARGLLGRVVAILSSDDILEAVGLLVPQEIGFLGHMMNGPELFGQGDGIAGADEAASVAQQLWEFTLCFLVVDRGSAFNRRSYLDHLLREMAAGQNRDCRQLIQVLLHRMEKPGIPNFLRDILSSLLLEIYNSYPESCSSPELEVSSPVFAEQDPTLERTAVTHLKQALLISKLQTAREQTAREQTAREQTAREEIAREEIAREEIAREEIAREQTERKQTEREQTEREQTEREQTEREQTEREQVEREQVEREQVERELVERELVERELVERELVERELVERELVERELVEREQVEREQVESEQVESEQVEREQVEREQVEREQVEREQIEREQIEREQIEREQVEREQVEREQIEREQAERERAESHQVGRQIYWQNEKVTEYDQEIYIANAGQVLAAPYLSQLFLRLELVKEGAFINRRACERAIHLLQYMVDASVESPEYLLVLNKILCGIDLRAPVAREVSISETEQKVIEGLIQGMIGNWEAIGNTSVTGFRESFLQREGRLQLRGEHWHLLVESRCYDLLLDRLPWSFSMIKFPWMPLPVQVEWHEGL